MSIRDPHTARRGNGPPTTLLALWIALPLFAACSGVSGYSTLSACFQAGDTLLA